MRRASSRALFVALLATSAASAFGQPIDANQDSILPQARSTQAGPQAEAFANAVGVALKGSVSGLESFLLASRTVTTKKEGPKLWPPLKALRFQVKLSASSLGVIRLRTRSASETRGILEELIAAATRERLIMDQRGKELLIVWGDAALRDPKVAGRHLAAIWGAGKTPDEGRGTLAVLPPSKIETWDFAVFTRVNGGFYQAAGHMMRMARKGTAEGVADSSGMKWRFLDKLQNELRVTHSVFHLHGLISPEATMTFSMCATKAKTDAEWTYLLALLEERKTPPVRAKGMLKILDELPGK